MRMYKPAYTSESFKSFKSVLRQVVLKEKEIPLSEDNKKVGGGNKAVLGILTKIIQKAFSGVIGIKIFKNHIRIYINIPKPYITGNILKKIKDALLRKVGVKKKKKKMPFIEGLHERAKIKKQADPRLNKVDSKNRKVLLEFFEIVMSRSSEIEGMKLDEDEDSVSIEFRFPALGMYKIVKKMKSVFKVEDLT